ncbi:hypothetical protein MLD38_037445 [Melastoma candidum]|uniref:Uncharacterized protein n=1 Tax=Melastoma candidum TaxID=119954 RepID=A0ACB9LNX6_9MYRT|nr:hypothetical protein MLD38_037445 [Melastoma candidum]
MMIRRDRYLDVLQNRSLIKVLNVDDDDSWRVKDKYWMHDLIREMGREIVSSESPSKRSRLWDPELALHIIRQKQGTHLVLAIDQKGGYGLLTGKEFEGMSNLRFLNLQDEAELSGKFRNFRDESIVATLVSGVETQS